MNKQKNKYSVIVASFSGDAPLEFSVSESFLKIAIVLCVAVIIGTFFGARSMMVYRNQAEEYQQLVSENEMLQEQVMSFAATTSELEDQLNKLQSFDSSIRDMLEIEDGSGDTKDPEPETQLPNDEIAAMSLRVTDATRTVLTDRSGVLDRTLEEVNNKLNSLVSQVPDESESFESLEEDVEIYTKTLAATPDIWPVRGVITSYYGYRRSPFGGGTDFHLGIDIGVNYNTPVLATAPGTVVERRYVYGYGYYLTIDHGMGFKTRYAHLNKYNVQLGDIVEKGQVIAYSGNSGASTGPHLHYEVWLKNATQNPLNYLP